jgi:hypothetical protein
MNSREKVIFMINEVIAIEKYAGGFTLTDYANEYHAQHIQKAAQKILEFLFKEQYGNSEDAAAHALLLILIKQVSQVNLPPERLRDFIITFLPGIKVKFESILVEIINLEENEDAPDIPTPFNPLLN